jgi:hypothetical protein
MSDVDDTLQEIRAAKGWRRVSTGKCQRWQSPDGGITSTIHGAYEWQLWADQG